MKTGLPGEPGGAHKQSASNGLGCGRIAAPKRPVTQLRPSKRGAGVTKRKRGKPQRAKVVSSKVLFRGRVFTLKRDRISEPGGVVTTREIIVHPGSVVVLPVLSDGRIVLIRQYRHAAGQYLWELVAGHKEPNESVVTGVHRELLEETGYTAHRVRKLLEFYPSPGLLGERMDLFLAEGLTKGKAQPEDDERITQRIFTLREAMRWIRSGKIIDSKTVSGILFYANFVARKGAR
jgi:ADP-ribose pyrophosphatase